MFFKDFKRLQSMRLHYKANFAANNDLFWRQFVVVDTDAIDFVADNINVGVAIGTLMYSSSDTLRGYYWTCFVVDGCNQQHYIKASAMKSVCQSVYWSVHCLLTKNNKKKLIKMIRTLEAQLLCNVCT